MTDSNDQISRRSVLKGAAAVGGAGFVAAGSMQSPATAQSATTSSAASTPGEEWFAKRIWSVSGNKATVPPGGTAQPARTLAKAIHRPTSGREIAELVASLPADTPIACVCGGHESSNVAAVAAGDAALLDLAALKTIQFDRDDEGLLATVGAGVVFRELVEAVRDRGGALPVGTGAGVGVVGYLTNGGISGYFSRRLGLLGQRVERMTVVTPSGELRVVTPDDPLFTAMLGAGSALGIVVDATVRVAEADAIRCGEQRVLAWEDRAKAVAFTRGGMRLLAEKALPDDSVSMELVVSATGVLVLTMVFYDTFQGDPAAFVEPFEKLAEDLELPVVASSHWDSWYEIAAALWPVIEGQKGDPLAMLTHCVGTKGVPGPEVLDFISDTMVAKAPLDEAELSIVEIRTLGGAISRGRELPSGNCHHDFFVDLIPIYDAGAKTPAQLQSIVDRTSRIMDEARGVDGLVVEFSGTHSQPDDAGATAEAGVILGTPAMVENIRQLKSQVDPNNRLRFHPYARFL